MFNYSHYTSPFLEKYLSYLNLLIYKNDSIYMHSMHR